MIVTATISQTEKAYWIIVSDEGPGSFPHKHNTYQSAYDESIRLSKVKPGLKFNIFKYVGHAVSTEPRIEFKTYSEPDPSWYSYWKPTYYNTKDIPF
jgi:hypothetical protein